MPVVPTNLFIYNKRTNKIQHQITLKRPQTYKIEDDNRLVINIPEPKIMPAGEYFINTDNRLFVSQDICLKGKGKISPNLYLTSKQRPSNVHNIQIKLYERCVPYLSIRIIDFLYHKIFA